MVAVFSGCSKKEKNLNSLESIKESKKIVVGIEEGYPPMEFRDENRNLVGFDVDFAKEIDKIIDNMEKDGTLSKLSIKWFGFDSYK